MTKSLISMVRFVAVAALMCLTIFPEYALARGGGGNGGLPTKGTCGFLVNMHYPFAYLYDNPGNGWGLDALGTIDFLTHTISINLILQDHPNPPGSNFTESQVQIISPFTTAAGPIPGSFTLTFTLPDNSPFTINLIPVNVGKTILMQGFNPNAGGQDGSVTGRCEM